MNKKIKLPAIILGITFLVLAGLKAAQSSGECEFPVDLKLARKFFMEAKDLADRDHSQLWGVNMYGSMMFVEPKTRFIVANEADAEGKLKKEGEVYVGQLEPGTGIANTVINWGGKRWLMINWDALNKDNPLSRKNLMMHEHFHRIQDEIGFPSRSSNNLHLDKMWGRIWLKMEWNALEKAVVSEGKERKQAIADALVFRNYRQRLFDGARQNEQNLELNEGVAEYTGFILSHLSKEDQMDYFKSNITHYKMSTSYVRSFAYLSGPLYGYLLYQKDKKWNQKLKPETDLSVLLKEAYSVKIPENLQEMAEAKKRSYNYDKVYQIENDLETARIELNKALTEKFVNGPVVEFALVKMNFTFNPSNIKSFEGHGTVYPTMKMTDLWGSLGVNGGMALINNNWSGVRVSAKNLKIKPDIIEGEGWTLKLSPGWMAVSGERLGDLEIVEIKKEEESPEINIENLKQKFLDGPVLVCKISEKLRYQFAPGANIKIPEVGTVYKAPINITDEWGLLKIESGYTMIDKERSKFLVSLPLNRGKEKLSGDGWVLYLNDGWEILTTENNKVLVKK